jgi:glycosyltransferase involved in cell wall biosynthesis
MPTCPEVSIILPTFNRAHLLPRAIRSILNQTFSNFELIIVNDSSTDETESVIQGFTDLRIVYRRQEPQAGAAAGENLGISIARGSYIAFIDDDDEWFPTKLEVQVKRFRTEPETTGVVYTGRWRIKNGEKFYGPPTDILSRQGDIHKEIFTRETFVPLICAMVRKECFDRAGLFDATLPASNDYDLWIRFSKHYRFIYIPEPLVNVHHTEGSISNNPEGIIEARKMLLVKHADEFRTIGKRISAFYLCQIGSLLIAQGEVTEGRRYLGQALARFPWNPGFLLALCASFFGQTFYLKVRGWVYRFVAPTAVQL